jgi:glycosyltransferase involved in cell wall biosynthesis
MRVLMLTNDSQMIDRRILQEAATLAGAGYEVDVLAGFQCREPGSCRLRNVGIHRYDYDWDDERLKVIRAKVRKVVNHDRVIGLVNRAFMFVARRYLAVNPFDRFIIAQAERFPSDVVHVHDLPMLPVGVRLADMWGVPLVYDAHELYYAQDVLPIETQKKYFALEKKLIRRPEIVITVNEFIAQLMADRYGVAPPNVLYNAAEAPEGTTIPGEPTLRERVGVDGPIILFQGWLSPERNIETVVRAMAYVPEPAIAAFIGYGPQEEVLKRIARELGVERRVKFLGMVPAEKLPHYTKDATLGVIPYLPIDDNHRYCSPNKFFEYVLAGVPILGHELAFFQMMGKRYDVVRCTDFTSPEAVGRKIAELLGSGEMDRLRANCEEARKVLNWETEGRKLLDLYSRLSVPRAAAA